LFYSHVWEWSVVLDILYKTRTIRTTVSSSAALFFSILNRWKFLTQNKASRI